MSIDRISSQSSFYEAMRNQLKTEHAGLSQETEASVVDIKGETEEITKEKLEEVVKGLNEFLQPSQTALKFELHDELQEYYVQIVDMHTKEIVREIPPKKILDMYATMMKFVGLIVDKKI